MTKYFDAGSLAIIVLTFVLFLAAVFTSGTLHDLLLEAGVFLVSVKLIVAAYKGEVQRAELGERLDRIEGILREIQDRRP